jgi:class 3 adenylate cyclase/tetratricopeptide (TPR) repeat protein
VQRCPSCGEENPDRARFCLACATRLAQAATPGETRKVVTIVFSDLTGSTALGERLDPEALRHVMNRYYDAMSVVIERHGGTVEKFVGDAVMAVFGIPLLHEDDALRAVRAAVDMQSELVTISDQLQRDHGTGLKARIGVNTGEVVAGDPSAGQRLVTGDAVNVAARLEQAAPPGSILLGETTHRLLRDAVEAEPVAPLDLKGKSEPVPAYRVLRVRPDTAGHERNLDSPMVGRDKELQLFSQALERIAADRTSHLFTLLGAAGVGKSRLVHEFLSGSASHTTVLSGRCLSYGDGITFYALGEIVRSAAGIADTDDPAAAAARLRSVLADAEDAGRVARTVGSLFGWDEPAEAEDAFWGVRRLFEHLARDRPLVLVFDDIHWAEPLLLDLIDHLADWTRDAEVLVVCVARPELLELRPVWGGGKVNATVILLEPLGGDDASRLVDNLLGDIELPDAARDRILAAAEGNPLFVEEMLEMLIDDGLLRFEEGTWRAAADLAEVTVPPTIQLLLAARLDRLDAEERAVIERGSVEGKIFHSGAVTSLSPEAMRPRVRSRLLMLARKELIRPDRAEFAGEDAFRFRHLLIRDAAYQAMPKEQRAELHEGFAAWLTEAAGDRAAEYEEILGHHLEQAFRYRTELGAVDDRARAIGERAATYLRSSGNRASKRGDFEAATPLLERAADVADGRVRARILTDLAELRIDTGDFPNVLAAANDAIEVAEAAGDRSSSLRARLVREEAGWLMDPSVTLAGGVEFAEEMLKDPAAQADLDLRDRISHALAQLYFWQGQSRKARLACEELIPRIDRLGFGGRRLVVGSLCSDAYFGATPLEEGFGLVARARELSQSSLRLQLWILGFEGALHGMAGHEGEADETFQRMDRSLLDLGDRKGRAAVSQPVAENAMRQGRPEAAEAVLRPAVEYYDEIGEAGHNSTLAALLATALCEQERFDEASVLVDKSRSLAGADDFAAQAQYRWALGYILARQGRNEEAVSALDEALAFVGPTDYLFLQADTCRIRGEILTMLGRTDEARASFDEARARYAAKGDVQDLGRIP